jgi:thymidylate synthase ThyX
MKIYAKILADSISPQGNRFTTFEIQLPKVLISELNTHGMLSRNLSSSRAIPVATNTEIESFEPLYWGKNQAGMVAKEEEIDDKEEANKIWNSLILNCKESSKKLADLGLHKQWANRPNDWHTMAKGVLSGTDWKNFLALRYHLAAQPEMFELAKLINHQLDYNEPFLTRPGEWHLPYIGRERLHTGDIVYCVSDETGEYDLDLETAKKFSVASCAQVSYRKSDMTLEKAERIIKNLFTDNPKHMSPAEHLGTPMTHPNANVYNGDWEEGVTHMRRDKSLWSAKLRGWIQYRQLFEQESVPG